MGKPTVGRTVHFYNHAYQAGDNNSVGPGPYAAVVVQTFSSGDYANLKVLIPFGADLAEGSVSEAPGGVPQAEGRYWVWPPVV